MAGWRTKDRVASRSDGPCNTAKCLRDSVRSLLSVALMLIACWPASLFAARTAMRYRTSAFQALAIRTQPAIDAIEEYRHENGRYPNCLKDLVPQYLERMPRTDMAGYPHFQYQQRESDEKVPALDFYELKVYCSVGINFDVFVYWPDDNYPEYMYGGYVQRIERWAYMWG